MQIAMGVLCVLVPMTFLFLFTLDGRLASIIVGTALLLLTTANHYVYEFQGNELTPLSFLSAGTAANVITNYSFTFPAPLVYSWIIWGLLIFSALGIPALTIRRNRYIRYVALIIGTLCLGLWYTGTRDLPAQTWGRSGTLQNGYLLNFSLELKTSHVRKPDGYTSSAVAALEAAYENISSDSPRGENPDIIVIMSESFSDLTVLGSPVRTDQEVMPFYDSLTNNTIRGYALTSAYGGMTANSEFEFLTSLSMAFLPTASVPYQQYLVGSQYSLVSVLKENGYTCCATHPFQSSGWSRERVYRDIGFDDITFLEAYPQDEMIRDFVSDREMFQYITDRYEQQSENESLFLFGITMQNHGGYDNAGYPSTIHLNGYQNQYIEAEQYLSLLNESDSALAELISYFQAAEDDVIIVLFGDHLPDLPMSFYEEIHGGPFETIDQQMLTYTVPFFIWANFDIPEEYVNCTSLNFISCYLLDTAGVDLPPFYCFLSDLKENIPAMNALGYYSKNQGSFIRYADATSIEAEWIHNYEILQYNNLFEKTDVSLVFWGDGQ